jgi:nitrate reductase NapAB chaperone NapD
MPLDENTNLEPISLIWLDNMADATQENREIQDKFRSVINYLKVFDNCDACEDYIRDEEQNKIILIVNGRLGQQIIEQIHHLKQIQSVFVFCMNKERNEIWAKKYKKVLAFFLF